MYITKNYYNFSRKYTSLSLDVLNYGPSFVVVPKPKIILQKIPCIVKKIFNKIQKMNPFFNEQQSSQNFEKHLTDITLAKHSYNITKVERDQLNFISNTFDLVITKADKEAKLILIDNFYC